MGEGTAVLRIRKTRWKVAYFAAFLVVANVVRLVLWPVIPLWAVSLSGALLAWLVLGVAVRCFRGSGEAIAPPRPWWRMTARPTAGFVLGSLFIVSVVWATVREIADGSVSILVSLLSSLMSLAIGALFLNSSIHLVRDPPPTVPEAAPLPAGEPIKP